MWVNLPADNLATTLRLGSITPPRDVCDHQLSFALVPVQCLLVIVLIPTTSK